MNIDQQIWFTKHRPKVIEDLVLPDSYREKMEGYVNTRTIPHLLFAGAPGTGKTTIAHILIRAIDPDNIATKMLNASQHRGIDTVRDIITPFAMARTRNHLKIVFLDEFDGTTKDFQDGLRNLMETHAQSTRFIMTCNYINKIEDAIQSRCTLFQFQQLPKNKVVAEAIRILNAENVTYQEDEVFTLVEDFYPDIRKVVNSLQQHTKDGKLRYAESESLQNLFQKVAEYIQAGKYTELVNHIASIPIDYTTVYKCLFDNAEFYFKSHNVAAIRLEIFESMYKAKFVADPIVNFLAFTIRCMRLCRITDDKIR